MKEKNIGMVDNKEMGDSILASTAARYIKPETGQPVIGIININRDVDYSKINSFEYFEGTIIHEFTHILGFSNYFFQNFHNIFAEVDQYGIHRAYINSSKVIIFQLFWEKNSNNSIYFLYLINFIMLNIAKNLIIVNQ